MMASHVRVYHGPRGSKAIAERVHAAQTDGASPRCEALRTPIVQEGEPFFDTVRVRPKDGSRKRACCRRAQRAHQPARLRRRRASASRSTRPSTRPISTTCRGFGGERSAGRNRRSTRPRAIPAPLKRTDLPEATRRSTATAARHELLRYIHAAAAKDLSLTTSMIPLGSCTMKLNATTEMSRSRGRASARSTRSFRSSRPKGYAELFDNLSRRGSARSPASRRARCSPTPARRASTRACSSSARITPSNGQEQRNVCLIPTLARTAPTRRARRWRHEGRRREVRRRRQHRRRRPAGEGESTPTASAL